MNPLHLRFTLGICIGALAIACTQPNPVDIDSDSSSSGDGTSSGGATESSQTSADDGVDTTSEAGDDSSTSSGTECPEGQTCPGSIGGGWVGPVIVIENPTSEDPPSCPSEYPEYSISVSKDLIAEPAACGCSCGEPENFDCYLPARRYTPGDPANVCDGGIPGGVDLYAGCYGEGAQPFPEYAQGYSVFESDSFGGSCDPIPSVDLPDAAFSIRVTACGLQNPEDCEEGLESCSPSPPEGSTGQLCIWHEGDVACPADGPFADRTVQYTGVVDERACSECSCGQPSGRCRIQPSDSPGCQDVLDGEWPPFTCFGGYDSWLISPDASCEPSTTEPIGEARGSNPVTTCCYAPR